MKLRVFSRKLLGIQNPNCAIPACSSTMESTGYIVFRSGPCEGWYLEFRCPEHGIQLCGQGPWQKAIEEAVAEQLGPDSIFSKS
jgi:hypothetical protein